MVKKLKKPVGQLATTKSEESNQKTTLNPILSNPFLKIQVVELVQILSPYTELIALSVKFTMIPKDIYYKLDQKLVLCPINISRIGVVQQKFSLDEHYENYLVVFISIVIRSDKEQEFSINC